MSGFRYCLNSSTIKPTPILDKIRIAAEAGYEGIELWHDDMDKFIAEGGTLEEIRQAVDTAGIEVPTTIMLKGWFDTEGDDHAAGMAECERKFQQSAAVGAPFAVAGPPHGPVDLDQGGRHYAELMELGLKYGVRPAMEYLGFAQELNTIEAAMEVMDRSGHPEATIILDPFHNHRGGGPMESIRKLTADQVAMSHFNDAPADPPANEQRDPDRVLPGEGNVDLKKYCDLLREIGYQGWLSLELFRQDLWDRDPAEVAALGLECMKKAAES